MSHTGESAGTDGGRQASLPASGVTDGPPEPGTRKYHYILSRQWTPRPGVIVSGGQEGFLWLRRGASRIEVIEYLKAIPTEASAGMIGPGVILFFALEPDDLSEEGWPS